MTSTPAGAPQESIYPLTGSLLAHRVRLAYQQSYRTRAPRPAPLEPHIQNSGSDPLKSGISKYLMCARYISYAPCTLPTAGMPAPADVGSASIRVQDSGLGRVCKPYTLHAFLHWPSPIDTMGPQATCCGRCPDYNAICRGFPVIR